MDQQEQIKRQRIEDLAPRKIVYLSTRKTPETNNDREDGLITAKEIINEAEYRLTELLSRYDTAFLLESEFSVPGSRINTYGFTDGSTCVVDKMARAPINICDVELQRRSFDVISCVHIARAVEAIASTLMSHGADIILVAKMETPGGMEWSEATSSTDAPSLRLIRCYDINTNSKITYLDCLYGVKYLDLRSASVDNGVLTIADDLGTREIKL